MERSYPLVVNLGGAGRPQGLTYRVHRDCTVAAGSATSLPEQHRLIKTANSIQAYRKHSLNSLNIIVISSIALLFYTITLTGRARLHVTDDVVSGRRAQGSDSTSETVTVVVGNRTPTDQS